MNRAERRAQGLCARCERPAFRGGRCEEHYAAAIADNRARSRRPEYQERRRARYRAEHPDARPNGVYGDEAPPWSLRGWHVYTLHDPDTDAARYVGLTSQPRQRWHLHRAFASAVRRGEKVTPVSVWVADVRDAGKLVTMRIVGPAADEAAGRELERETIQRLVAEGADLFNIQGRAKPPRRCGYCKEIGHTLRTCTRPRPTNAEHIQGRRERLRAQGLCVWCAGPPVPGRSRCESCIQKGAASKRAQEQKSRERRIASGGEANACRACGVTGHNRRTCPVASAA